MPERVLPVQESDGEQLLIQVESGNKPTKVVRGLCCLISGPKDKKHNVHGVIGDSPKETWSKHQKQCPVFVQTTGMDSNLMTSLLIITFFRCLGILGSKECLVILIL